MVLDTTFYIYRIQNIIVQLKNDNNNIEVDAYKISKKTPRVVHVIYTVEYQY